MGLLALQFNNEEIVLALPSNAQDLDDYPQLNANDQTRIRIPRDWNWIREVYKVTLQEYKEVLHEWNKGTGGGSGLQDKFETWTDAKLNKYDIDPSVYDHCDVASRPSILMEGYAKRKSYLTVIFMWDEKKEYILSSKYTPVRKGRSEAGLSSKSSSSSLTNSTIISPMKRHNCNGDKDSTNIMKNMVTDVITTVMENPATGESRKKKKKKSKG